MLPSYDEYGGWPTSGEIDLVESRGEYNFDSVIILHTETTQNNFVSISLFLSFSHHSGFIATGNEILNDESGNHVGNGHMGSTLHWSPFFEGNRYYLTTESR